MEGPHWDGRSRWKGAPPQTRPCGLLGAKGRGNDTYSLAAGGLFSQVAGRDDVPVVKTNGNTALGDLDCGHPETVEPPLPGWAFEGCGRAQEAVTPA